MDGSQGIINYPTQLRLFSHFRIIYHDERHAVAQLSEVLRYKPHGRGFDSRWCHWKFSLT
jgi:hypothetical protein